MEIKRMDKEMYTDDYTDEISELVEEAHAIFNATTVSEVMDMRDRQSQEDFLNKIYNNPEPEASNRYLDVVKRLRRATYLRVIHTIFVLSNAMVVREIA
jgi:hypothetical protein